ncbi:DUF3168 domain-containing protein [Cohaesibacter haloalkalitolerans]|uniref:DUF3168 domain-containing protein n=1 Tax=Cohaesibacter haloalkalitolerans TaxID=1162980 RepID=UPI000E65DD66|nr:DUF3168 domain-containing protein [Cohaesibacter haloalkalitolerans]
MALDFTKAQEMLVSTLKAAAICDGRIYDFLPESPSKANPGHVGQVYPFCILGSYAGDENDVGNQLGEVVFQMLEVHSRDRGKAEAMAIAAKIRAALHKQLFTLADGASMRVIWRGEDINGPENRVYFCDMRFEIKLYEACT